MIVTVLLVLMHLHSSHSELQGTANVPPGERQVLMELFAATGGAQWTNGDGWGSDRAVCEWHGVWCDFVGGDARRPIVAGLSLANNNLRGTLPLNLSDLRNLQHLDVSRNRLRGEVPASVLQRWDRHELEYDGSGNLFSNMVVNATFKSLASGVLCGIGADLRYRAEFDELSGRARLESVRCSGARSRETYCLVREGTTFSLSRLARALDRLGYAQFGPDYDYPFGSTTHQEYLTTSARWGNGVTTTVTSYGRQGPLEVWTAQQLFVGLVHEASWDRESRNNKCDFEK